MVLGNISINGNDVDFPGGPVVKEGFPGGSVVKHLPANLLVWTLAGHINPPTETRTPRLDRRSQIMISATLQPFSGEI